MLKLARIIAIGMWLAASPLMANPNAEIFQMTKYSKQNNPLLKIAKLKGHVGIIPYSKIKGQIFIFLGQELPGGRRENAGAFSDLGTTIHPNGTSVLDHALLSFKIATMGHMRLSSEDVLKNGHLLLVSEKDRNDYFIFLRFSKTQYEKTLKFLPAKARLKASGLPNSHLEREGFLWVSLDDLLAQSAKFNEESHQPVRFHVRTPTGETMNILIHGFFQKYCLEESTLPYLIKGLAP